VPLGPAYATQQLTIIEKVQGLKNDCRSITTSFRARLIPRDQDDTGGAAMNMEINDRIATKWLQHLSTSIVQ
jgi:hypothetical protein